jgi:type II secretory pathway component HofQ
MRVAIIVVAVVLVSSPALASPSCMTQSEARAKFATSHLYWHGTGHCWDATPPSRQRLAQRNKTRGARPAARETQDERETVEEKKPSRATNDSRWREAMSKARPEDFAGTSVTASAQAQVSIAPSAAPAPPRADFYDRWVEIAQRTPPIVDKAGPADLVADARAAEPLVTPVRVMLALLVLLLALGAFELLFRRSEWRR